VLEKKNAFASKPDKLHIFYPHAPSKHAWPKVQLMYSGMQAKRSKCTHCSHFHSIVVSGALWHTSLRQRLFQHGYFLQAVCVSDQRLDALALLWREFELDLFSACRGGKAVCFCVGVGLGE
jgi:hypothetical protein